MQSKTLKHALMVTGIVAAISVAGAGYTVWAETVGEDSATGESRMEAKSRRMFNRFDENNDGVITADELPDDLPERMAERFERADADGNGEVTLQEARAFMRVRFDERFEEADTDDSGSLSREEMIARATERANEAFDRLDADEDGSVTKEEIRERWRGGKRG